MHVHCNGYAHLNQQVLSQHGRIACLQDFQPVCCNSGVINIAREAIEALYNDGTFWGFGAGGLWFWDSLRSSSIGIHQQHYMCWARLLWLQQHAYNTLGSVSNSESR